MALLRTHWLRLLTHLAALAPFGVLLWDYARANLGVNPIQEITYRTGYLAILMLLLSLACTPLNTLFGLRQLLPLRRPLGLYAFFYASLHLLTFVGLDYGFDLGLILEDVGSKRFILAGLATFLLLLPLALTSTKGWMRRLGKRWKQLHRLVYLAAGLAVTHWIWLVKSDYREPLLYGALAVLLLLLRLAPVRRWFSNLRNSTRMARPTGADQR